MAHSVGFENEIEFDQGWFMDCLFGVPGLMQSYLIKMSELAVWAPNVETRVIPILERGEGTTTWTTGRDTAKAMIKLLQVPKEAWDPHTCISV